MVKIAIFQVDAFASSLFRGNPAAVCPLDEWASDGLLQNIASENNLSETAFFVKEKEGFHIRWFTPQAEVSLCGHATLATAAVIYEKLGYKKEFIRFNSRSGELKVRKDEDEYVLDFPSDKLTEKTPDPEIVKAIGAEPIEYYETFEDILMVFDHQNQVGQIKPDFAHLAGITKRGVIVTSPGMQSDFVSRFFAPAVGISEDPVTGSAHTALAPYWSKKLKKKNLTAFQLSKRGGKLKCYYLGERTEISGKAVFYLEGVITV